MELTIVLVEEDGSEIMEIREQDARYTRDHFLNEPHCEPVTIKLTASLKRKLKEFVADEGYTSLGPAIRELLMIGLNYYPVVAYLESETKQNKYRDHPIVKRFRL